MIDETSTSTISSSPNANSLSNDDDDDNNNSLSILASPVNKPKSRLTRRSFQIENIVKRIEESEKKIINFEAINQRVLKRVEAEIAKDNLIDDVNREQMDRFLNAEIDSEFYFGDALTERRGIFTGQPLTLFRSEHLYMEAKVKMGNFEQLINRQPEIKVRAKLALRLISVDKELHRTGAGKTLLVEQRVLVKLDEMFPTLLKILINYGVDLNLLDAYVHRYKNIKINYRYRTLRRQLNNTTMDDFDLYACFPQVLDCLDMILDDSKLPDSIMVHDYLAMVMLLFVDYAWSINRICMRALKQFLLNIFQRAERTSKTIAACTELVLRLFESYPAKFVDFLMFLPNRMSIGKKIKFQVCQAALQKSGLTVLKSVDNVCDVIESLHQSPITNVERYRVVLIIRELLGSLGVEKDNREVGAAFNKLADKLKVAQEDSDSLKLYNMVFTLSRFYDPELDLEQAKADKAAAKAAKAAAKEATKEAAKQTIKVKRQKKCKD